MSNKKKGPVFRVTGLPAEKPDEELNNTLKTAIDDSLLDKEKLQLDFTSHVVPSCYSHLERVALVEFHGGIPDFLSDLVANPLGDWQIEMDEYDISFDRHFFGFTQLYMPKPNAPVTADIIAITGLDGHAYGSWRGKGNLGRMWLRDFLSKDLPSCRTMIYGFNSKLSSHGVDTIMDYGRELMEELRKIRNSDELRQRPLFFIAHSFGGIILAHCLVKAVQTNEDDHPTIATLHKATYGMLLFGTPHKGLVVDDIQRMLAGKENDPRSTLLHQIQEKSDLLAYQLADFKNLIRDRKIVSFYETQQTRRLEFNQEKKRWERTGSFVTAVNADSALLQLPDHMEEKVPLDLDHSSMVKFDSRNNRGYTSARIKLEQFEKDAPGVVTARFLPVKHKLKPAIRIPFPRDAAFVGREDVIAQIHEHNEAVTNNNNRAALVGLGGVGKSQIAIEHAYRFKESPRGTWVFWLYAATASRFEHDYRDIARVAEIPGREDPRVDIMQLVHDWLCDESNGPWLMILDNVDDAKFFFDQERPLERFLAHRPNGNILITSRNRAAAINLVGSQDHVVQVEPMDEENALKLLNTKVPFTEATRADAKKLVRILEYIPLAITHAASYIRASASMKMADYLRLFSESESNLMSLLGREKYKDLRRDHSTRLSVIATWQISFAQIQKTEESAAVLLALMSMFDRQGIPILLLREDADKLEFENALDLLVDFSLVRMEVGNESVGMHRLVQLSMKKWLEADWESSQQTDLSGNPPDATSLSRGYARCPSHALKIIALAYPYGQFETRDVCMKYLPHAYAVLSNTSHRSQDTIAARASLLHCVGRYLLYDGRYKEAEQYAAESVKLRKDAYGLERLSTLRSMAGLSSVYTEQGRWEEAEKLCMEVMQLMKSTIGEEHIDTMRAISDLGIVYMHKGQWEDAEKFGGEALELRKRVLGEEHKDTLVSMNNLASVYFHQGQLKEGEELELRMLEGRKKVLGHEHPETLMSMMNLAATYTEQGRHKEAEELEILTVQGLTNTLGEDHGDTLKAKGNLASTYMDQRRWEEAERFGLEVLATKKRTIGEEHPSTVVTMNNLGATYIYQGRWKEAEQLLENAIQIAKRVMGDEHPGTLTCMNSFAQLYAYQEQWKEAEELPAQVMEARKRVLGMNHKDTLRSIKQVAGLREHLSNIRGDDERSKEVILE
ncbi:hypothetical protein ACHAPU_002315 [Fusarium lateritium]